MHYDCKRINHDKYGELRKHLIPFPNFKQLNIIDYVLVEHDAFNFIQNFKVTERFLNWDHVTIHVRIKLTQHGKAKPMHASDWSHIKLYVEKDQ